MPSLIASTPRGFNLRSVPLPTFPRIGHVYADLLNTRGTEIARTEIARTAVARAAVIVAVASALRVERLSESYKAMQRDEFTPALEIKLVCTAPALDSHLYLAHNLTVST